jgi:heptaprenyl diphosphate synthase
MAREPVSVWMNNCQTARGQVKALVLNKAVGRRHGGRMSRREVYESIFSAKALFFTGLLIMPALLFNPSTEYRVIQFLFFWFLAWLSGKKTNFIFTILITVLIILFNLIIPYGRVLFSVGAFRITSGALEAGIHRAVTLQALIMLSKVTIRQDLKIPGTFGQLLGESLQMFSALMSRKLRLTEKNIIVEIDNLMLELSKEELPESSVQEIQTKPTGCIVLIAVIIISWFPWLMKFKINFL